MSQNNTEEDTVRCCGSNIIDDSSQVVDDKGPTYGADHFTFSLRKYDYDLGKFVEVKRIPRKD